MRAVPRRRLRFALLCSAFALAAIATAAAVNRLYQTARREIAAQGERAVQQELAEARARVQTTTDNVRHTTIAELAAFHADGLAYALRQWDAANELVAGTFEWSAARGFLPGHTSPANAPAPEELTSLWTQFREWRAQNPAAARCELSSVRAFQTSFVRTLENPDFTSAELRYQGENLDMLTYSGHRADPWAGWAARADAPDAPWVFWYQAGPDAPVRGCFVDIAPVVNELREELSARRVARLELIAGRREEPTSAAPAAAQTGLAPALPGYSLVAAFGDVFVEKQSNARFAVATVASLLGLFVLGVAFLVVFSRREARDAERKTTFVSQVSHELRTPLTSIRMFADMLATPDLPEEKRAKFAGTISRESERLGALIERLLTFNALEKGKQTAKVERFDVAALARETLEEMDTTVREAGMTFVADIPEEAVFATIDRSAAKQALLNLVDNALKYARDGRIIAVTLDAAKPDDEYVRLRVSDRGPGVPRAMRERIFEPFVQGGGQALTEKSPGVGLGLSIARESLRALRGDVVLLFAERGAAFELRLPKDFPEQS